MPRELCKAECVNLTQVTEFQADREWPVHENSDLIYDFYHKWS